MPPIIPMVLYNGEPLWTVTKSFRQYQSGYEQFGDRLLDFRYELFDVNRYTEDELIDLSNLVSLVFLLDQDVSNDEILRRMGNMAESLKGMDKGEFEEFKFRILNIMTRNMDDDDKRKVQDEIESYEEASEMMHNLEKLYYDMKEEGIREGIREGIGKGREEGIREGLEKGMEKGKETKAYEIARKLLAMGLPLMNISEATGLTDEEVEELRKSMN